MENKIQVVAIDDEPETVSLLQAYLEMFGCEVRTALNGRDGMKAIEDAKPQVLILDLMLPDTDGYEICRRLREAPATADLPIIILSARTAREDVKRGFAMGATQYLKKPLDLAKLLAEIKRVAEVGKHIPPEDALQDDEEP